MHLREMLEVRELRDGDAAVLADLAEVVALEVGDHDELGEFLRVGLELEGELGVEDGIAAARARALDRTRGDVPAADAQEQFRRGGQDAGVAEVEKGAAGRGTAGEQMLEEAVGIAVEVSGEFLREVDLVDVAGGDVLLRAGDDGLRIRRGSGWIAIASGREMSCAPGQRVAPWPPSSRRRAFHSALKPFSRRTEIFGNQAKRNAPS